MTSDAGASGVPGDSLLVRRKVPASDVTRVAFDADEPDLASTRALLIDERDQFREDIKSYGWFEWVALFFPALHWLKTYDLKHYLWVDVLAGLSVGAMVVPQGMSYANLAGLPQVYGLYGAFVPPLVYSVLGSSRQLAVGPVAVTSLLLGSNIPDVMDKLGLPVNSNPNQPEDPYAQEVYNRVCIQIAFMAGCIYTGIGFLRLGWITNFLSHAVISGFMTGASVQIALSQVPAALGITTPRVNPINEQLDNIFNALDGFKWREFAMTMAFITILLVFRMVGGKSRYLVFLRACGPLTVCVLSIAIMNIFNLYKEPSRAKPYIKPIGKIPKGLPDFTGNWWTPVYDVGKQMSVAVLICFIDLCESISIAKALAQKNNYKLNATQELRAIGIANLAGALFNCYTTTGSFSRSAVNNAVGAQTQLASFVTGIMLMVVLLVLTPIFQHMSKNVQSAIIIVGVLQLFDYEEFFYLVRVSLLDTAVWLAAFLVVMFVSVEWGICAGVSASIAAVVFRSAFPSVRPLGRVPGTNFWRPVQQYPNAEEPEGYTVISINSPIYFANVEWVRSAVFKRVEALVTADPVDVTHHRSSVYEGNLKPLGALDAGAAHTPAAQDSSALPGAGPQAAAVHSPPSLDDDEVVKSGNSSGPSDSSGISPLATVGGAQKLPSDGVTERISPQQPTSSVAARNPLRFVVLDLSATPTIDATAVHFFGALLDELRDFNARLVLANPSGQIIGILRRARLIHKIGLENIQVDIQDAIRFVEFKLSLNNDLKA